MDVSSLYLVAPRSTGLTPVIDPSIARVKLLLKQISYTFESNVTRYNNNREKIKEGNRKSKDEWNGIISTTVKL